ncbi:hypothetical protein K488DRAFT_60899 [Vararia minispora EC-137]|uniref:Uncharacterized protein n=1 Tax=Vararia minispora EC-137 TaxID=1314806 RepID=A0ACB8Q759_9AGAM|nr:hypothetical protein K488DRAFT_60899 [Vararia minispora EC-137]
MLVVDLMHEFELSVWKALLLQLIRILHAVGPSAVQEFNERFRQISTFGASTIRRFAHNISDLKKLAARDFEDILQCCIPCFKGLLPEPHDQFVSDLLYLSAYWHSLAKLRAQTDTSLVVLDNVTVHLANALRHFADMTCAAFDTVETDGEYQARCQAENRQRAKGGASQGPSSGASAGGKQKKTFNLDTYKLHSLGDYVPTIHGFGTTDSYSTQLGETEHRVVKRRYGKTNFRNIKDQFVKMDVLETIHERMYEELEETLTNQIKLAEEPESIPGSAPRSQSSKRGTENEQRPYVIAADQGKSTQIWLTEWLQAEPQRSDLAYTVSRCAFRRYVRAYNTSARLHTGFRGETEDTPPPAVLWRRHHDLREIEIHNDTIYRHQTIAVNYMSYDVCQERDLVHVKMPTNAHCDIMMRAQDVEADTSVHRHPYRYTRVHGVYHANVFLPGNMRPQCTEFLFVRWFRIDTTQQGGPRTKRLDRVSFVDARLGPAFGFLDPAEIVRACHLLPAFAKGKTRDLLSVASQLQDFTDGQDWKYYYVSRFVNRDMMQHYLGWGIGHLNPPNFPHEAHDIVSTDDDCTLVGTRARSRGQAGDCVGEERGTRVNGPGDMDIDENGNDEEEQEEHGAEEWEDDEDDNAKGTGGDVANGLGRDGAGVDVDEDLDEDTLADRLGVFDS